MATEIGKINVQDLVQNDYKSLGIGINRRSSTNGIFAVNFTTIDQAKDSLSNLLLTKKGERVMYPEFGCDIWRVLFEPIIDDDIQTRLETVIIDAVNRWMPYINVTAVIVNSEDEFKDKNQIDVSIGFELSSNNKITDSIKISIKE
jgi:phage baseplate assembly protein W